MNNLPPQLKEAVNLFVQFERSNEHEKRVQFFGKAINILDTHLSENHESPHKEFVNNLKLAYTRKLLEQLSEGSRLPSPTEDWFSYLWLMLKDCQTEIEVLTKRSPSLRQSYDNFIQMWGDDAVRVLEREIQKRRRLRV